MFLAFDLCRFCVVIRCFHPRHNGQWPPTPKDFYTRSYPLHCFLILILEKEPVFPFSLLGAKQGNYWYHLYNVFGMTRSLTGDWTRDLPHSKPALYTRLSRRRCTQHALIREQWNTYIATRVDKGTVKYVYCNTCW